MLRTSSFGLGGLPVLGDTKRSPHFPLHEKSRGFRNFFLRFPQDALVVLVQRIAGFLHLQPGLREFVPGDDEGLDQGVLLDRLVPLGQSLLPRPPADIAVLDEARDAGADVTVEAICGGLLRLGLRGIRRPGSRVDFFHGVPSFQQWGDAMW